MIHPRNFCDTLRRYGTTLDKKGGVDKDAVARGYTPGGNRGIVDN
jgi:hypothetical protein